MEKSNLVQKLFLAGSLFLSACAGNADIISEGFYNPNKGIQGNAPYSVRYSNKTEEGPLVKIRIRNLATPINTHIVNRPLAPVEGKKEVTQEVYDVTQSCSF